MKKHLAITILLFVCLVSATPVFAGIADSLRDFLSLKETRGMTHMPHEAFRMGAGDDAVYMIINGIAPDAYPVTGSLPDYAIDSDKVFSAPSWVQGPFGACSDPCGGIRVASWSCKQSGVESALCDDDQPADVVEACSDAQACSSCQSLYEWGVTTNGKHVLSDGRTVWCHMATDGGGWELFVQLSPANTIRFDGLNQVHNNAQWNNRGGTGNTVVADINYTGPSGSVLTANEGLNWYIYDSPSWIRISLPAGSNEARFGFQSAYKNGANNVGCGVFDQEAGEAAGYYCWKTLASGVSIDMSCDYTGATKPALKCVEGSGIGELRYIMVR